MKRQHKAAEQQWRAGSVTLQYNFVAPQAKAPRPWWKFW